MANIPTTPQKPYHDDYDESKNYLRVLFRPQLGVQTRELNQMQTILQQQIGDFADSIYNNGSVVIPGEAKVQENIAYVKLKALDNLGAPLEDFYGDTISNNVGIEATLLYSVQEGDERIIYVAYKSSYTLQDQNYSTFAANNLLSLTTIENGEEVVYENVLEVSGGTDVTGYGLFATIAAGIYYYNGMFVPVEQQSLLLQKYSNVLSDYSVGLLFKQVIVTENEDSSLYDNAIGSSNFSAPGAHRLKIDAILVDEATVSESDIEDFTQVLKIQDGEIAKLATSPDYSVLEQTLARRTYDESGDYVVDPFLLEVREHLDNGSNRGVYTEEEEGDSTKLVYDLDPGKAYVRGFEIDKPSKTLLEVDKARTFDLVNNFAYFAEGGSYIEANLIPASTNQFPEVSALANEKTEVILYDGIGGSQIGTAILRGITRVLDDKLRFYISNIRRDDVDPILEIGGSDWKANTGTPLVPTAASPRLFQYSDSTVESIQSLNFDLSISRNATASSNSITISCPLLFEFFSGATSEYIVYRNNSTELVPVPPDFEDTFTVLYTPGTSTVTINGLSDATANYTVTTRITVKADTDPASLIKTKTLTTETETFATAAEKELSKSDGYRIVSIIGDTGSDYTSRYTFDGGQRDGVYDSSSIKLKPSEALPGDPNLTVTYEYYEHSSGYLFTSDSYGGPGAAEYETNPTYTDSSGKTYSLLNSLDFRPLINFDNTYANDFYSIYPNSKTTLDFNYYLSRKDIISLGSNGDFSAIQGKPALKPEYPNDISDSITLYKIDIPAYTFSDTISYISNDFKRFTMSDIATIENRLTELEKKVSLNILEQKAKAMDVNGAVISGSFTDSFVDTTGSNLDSDKFKCSLDIEKGIMRPESSTKSVDLDVSSSGNVRIHDDNIITLDYTEKGLIGQPFATQPYQINPFDLKDYSGFGRAIPSSDAFYDQRGKPYLSNYNGLVFRNNRFLITRYNTYRTFYPYLYKGYRNYWYGTNIIQQLANVYKTPIKSNPIETSSGKRLITNEVQPMMRERVIRLEAEGLQPNKRHWIWVDGKILEDSNISESIQGTSPFVTDSNGKFNAKITLAKDKYKIGSKEIVVADNNTTLSGVESSAVIPYFSTGNATRISGNSIRYYNWHWRSRYRLTWAKYKSDTYMAQTFIPAVPGGCFITSIDLYLYLAPRIRDVRPDDAFVILELREMNNGYPSGAAVEGSHVKVSAEDIEHSDDSSKPTNFKFKSPVYLENGVEYAFVVKSNSKEVYVWSSFDGQRDRLTRARAVKGPGVGKLFRPGYVRLWEFLSNDLKFNVNIANFNTPGTVVFNNNVLEDDAFKQPDVYHKILEQNPFTLTQGSTVVRVIHPNHDFAVGDTVTFRYGAGATPIPEGADDWQDIDSTKFITTDEGNPVVVTITKILGPDEYEFDTDDGLSPGEPVAGKSATVGGEGIIASQYVAFSSIYLNSEEITFNTTSVNWQFTGLQRRVQDTLELSDFVDESQQSGIAIKSNQEIDFDVSYVSKSSTDNDVGFTAYMSSSSSNVSPIIHLDRVSLVCTENRIVEREDANDESQARYVSKPITLDIPANKLKATLLVSKPTNTAIEVFYKAMETDVNVETVPWVEMTFNGTEPSADDSGSFLKYEYIQNDTNGPIPEFTKYLVKISMRSSLKTKVPLVSELIVNAIYE